jgi:hypothetical protein
MFSLLYACGYAELRGQYLGVMAGRALRDLGVMLRYLAMRNLVTTRNGRLALERPVTREGACPHEPEAAAKTSRESQPVGERTGQVSFPLLLSPSHGYTTDYCFYLEIANDASNQGLCRHQRKIPPRPF